MSRRKAPLTENLIDQNIQIKPEKTGIKSEKKARKNKIQSSTEEEKVEEPPKNITKKLVGRKNKIQSSSEEEKVEEPPKNITKKPVGKTALRGSKAAALCDTSSSDDSDSDSSQGGVGIYSARIQNTKNELKDTKKNFNIINKAELKKAEEEKLKKKNSDDSSDSDSSDSSSSESSSQDSDSTLSSKGSKFKKPKVSEVPVIPEELPSSPSPPPTPIVLRTKAKRKSTTALERQLKALEKIKEKSSNKSKKLQDSLSNMADNDDNNCGIDDVADLITIRVSTRTGRQRFEINKNQKMVTIYEKIAEVEKTRIENLILMFNEEKINFSDTPELLNLGITDMIECQYIKGKIQERIEIIENKEKDEAASNEDTPPNMFRVILQTKEGRKSRVKFFIAKDEPLNNMLCKYCEKMGLENSTQYMLEFDGDVVTPTENANDLDLDGDEIFDVKKSSKPTMQLVNENKKNYEFDDDILCV